MATAKPAPLTFALAAEQPRYPAGTLPDLKAVLTNRAPRPVSFCAYMLGPRILATLTAEDAEGQDYELYPFRPGRWVPVKPTDFRTIPPGKAFAVRLPLAESKIWGFVTSGGQPPLVTQGYALRGFPAGEVIFRARLSAQAPLYVGQSGAYDRKWEWKTVPDELPGAPSPLPRVFRGRLKGRGVVRFG